MNTMLKLSLVFTSIATLALPALDASAQEVTRMPETSQQSVGLEGGLDAAFVARATYTHRADFRFVPDGRIYARFTLPFLAADAAEWSFDGGVQATLAAAGNFRLALLVGPTVINSNNALFSSTALGIDGTLLLGYEGPHWGLSSEVGYEQIFGAYLHQSDLYRSSYYAGAKNGLYSMPGSTLRAGLRGGVRFGSFELVAKAGAATTGQLHAVNPPFYGTLGVAFAF